MPMPAYKDISQDEIKLMARAIVDQYETPTQKNCKFCHAMFDLAETKKIIGTVGLNHLRKEGFKWAGKFVNAGASGSASAIVKLNDGYYRFDTSNNIDYGLIKINYCDQCGRSLQ